MNIFKTLVDILHVIAGLLIIITGCLIATGQIDKVMFIRHNKIYGMWLVIFGVLLLLYSIQQLYYPSLSEEKAYN